MPDNKNINGNRETIQALNDAAKTIADYGKNIQKSVERIRRSCNVAGKTGASHNRLMLAKVERLEKLASLCSSASKKFLSSASKLVNGAPENKVLNEVLVYNSFLNDQIKCEESEVKHTLGMLRNERVDSTEHLEP